MPKQTQKKTTHETSLESRVLNLESQLARAMADYQNLEKRFERDSASIIKFGQVALVEKLLTFRDHLDLASQNLSDPSLTMLKSEFDKLLLEEGVTKIDTTGTFDPVSMECAETVPGKKDQVVKVVRDGFKLHDRILRPARVTVGNGQPTQSN